MTWIFTAKETTTIYKTPNNAKSYYIPRLQAGETAVINKFLFDEVWLNVSAKGVTGFVERRRGTWKDDSIIIPPPGPTIPPAKDYQLGWIKSDYEMFGMSHPERDEVVNGRPLKNKRGEIIQGLPQIIKFYETAATDIRDGTDTWRLSVEVFGKNAPIGWEDGIIEKRCRGVHKEGTAYADYSGGDWMNTVICASNIVYVMGDSERKAGELWTPVKVLQVGKYDAMLKQVKDYPFLAHRANISTRGLEGRMVIPFWHLEGNDCMVATYYRRGKINWLKTERIRILAEGEAIPPPYYR